MLCTGVPQGCVHSALGCVLCSTLHTPICTSTYNTKTIINYADDRTVIGLIQNNDGSSYKDEVQKRTAWCLDNTLVLNSSKTKELLIDFKRETEELSHPYSKGDNGGASQ